MGRASVTILGSGDAFSSGGRFHSSYLIEAAGERLLVDCGATTVAALKRQGVRPVDVDRLLVTHPHGDHIAGIPFLLLDYRYLQARAGPLPIAAPARLGPLIRPLTELLYPSFAEPAYELPVTFTAVVAGQQLEFGPFGVRAFPAFHLPDGASLSYQVAVDGFKLAFTGDTGWHESLVDLTRDTDLCLCECTLYDEEFAGHLSYRRLLAERPRLGSRRLLLTHVGPGVLARASGLAFEIAGDGMVIELGD